VREDWKVRGGQLIPGKRPEWMGIHRYEEDISLSSKWGFLFTFNARGYSQIIDYVSCKYQYRIFCEQVKNKPCVVNFIMRLIFWKGPHGTETVICTPTSPQKYVMYFCYNSNNRYELSKVNTMISEIYIF
jgi:hypothetical protein